MSMSMSTPSAYVCISHAADDHLPVERFCNHLSTHGFRYLCMDEYVPTDERDALLMGCALLVVLTSPEAARVDTCTADYRYMLSHHRPVVCVRLLPSELDERLFVGDGSAAERSISFPEGETETPDEPAVAMFTHRLYVRHLCRLAPCFEEEACVNDDTGHLIRQAVLAWQGTPSAQYELGNAYAQGHGLPALETDAAQWIGQAAAGSDPNALIHMGNMMLDGTGTDKDPDKALWLFSEAMRLNDPRGHYAYGLCCLYGHGMMKDAEMAALHLRKAASAGYIPAYYRLGLMYRDGIGVPMDWRHAVACLYTACCQEKNAPPLYGHRIAGGRFVCISMRQWRHVQLNTHGQTSDGHRHSLSPEKVKTYMARCHFRAVHDADDRRLEALDVTYDVSRYNQTHGYSRQKWLVAEAEGALGDMLVVGSPKDGIAPSPYGALVWYRRAMERGHSDVLFRMGNMYRQGRGVLKDEAQAVRLFRKCADFGNEYGQFALGVCYEQGCGVARDPLAAVTQYELAASVGYAPAQNNLGGCYEYGIGVPHNMISAVEWYTRAATVDQPYALCRLGICYERGSGVAQNHERAFHLYERAYALHHSHATYRLARCYDLGIYVNVNLSTAAHLYEQAAQAGVAEAAYAIGLCAQTGRGIRQDERAGFTWLTEASRNGSAQAAYEVGMCYWEGRATVQSDEHAVQAFRLAISLYDAGVSSYGREREEALPSLAISAKEAAGRAWYMLGYCTLYGRGIQAKEPAEDAMIAFTRASLLGHHGAMTAIGDMYAYGLTRRSDPTGEAARDAYERAAEGNHVEALLSLAEYEGQRIENSRAAGDEEAVREGHARRWKILARCAEQGSAEALQGLAVCAFFGWGTSPDRDVAHRFLRRAESRQGGGGSACLWLGDFYYGGWLGEQDLTAADAAYGYAAATSTLSPYPTYILRERWETRMETARRVRAQALYRMAILRAVGFGDDRRPQREEAFDYLCAAILAGHAGARDDLARMYAYEREQQARQFDEAMTRAKSKKDKKALTVTLSATRKKIDHLAWMTDYYAALRPTLQPFVWEPSPSPRENAPTYVLAPVTSTMRACALNHLGDCLFEGVGLRKDSAAAVSCYREAAETVQKRGEPVVGGIVWAQYNLGWCLLQGEGTAKEPREGIRWLTQAARYHAEAAYCLGQCYETGEGVDAPDMREAVKYYRKARTLEHPLAAQKLKTLEKQLLS